MSKILTQDQWEEKSGLKHNKKYNYSLVEYINSKTKVKIICPEHGEFDQLPADHIRGRGCIKCSYKKCGSSQRLNKDQFIEKANLKHKYFYDYSKVNYVNSITKISIICKFHGEFKQEANSHLQGTGCPKCRSSKSEVIIEEYLIKNNIKYTTQEWFKKSIIPCKNPKTNSSLYFDFYLPDYNLCIEFDGAQHYSNYFFVSMDSKNGESNFVLQKQRDQAKNKYCEDNNIRLLRIPYWKIKSIDIIINKKIKE